MRRSVEPFKSATTFSGSASKSARFLFLRKDLIDEDFLANSVLILLSLFDERLSVSTSSVFECSNSDVALSSITRLSLLVESLPKIFK